MLLFFACARVCVVKKRRYIEIQSNKEITNEESFIFPSLKRQTQFFFFWKFRIQYLIQFKKRRKASSYQLNIFFFSIKLEEWGLGSWKVLAI